MSYRYADLPPGHPLRHFMDDTLTDILCVVERDASGAIVALWEVRR